MISRAELENLHPVFKDAKTFPDAKIAHWDKVAGMAWPDMSERARLLFVAHQMTIHGHVVGKSKARFYEINHGGVIVTYHRMFKSTGAMPGDLDTPDGLAPAAMHWNSTRFGLELHRIL
jgi:hypothetical protein